MGLSAQPLAELRDGIALRSSLSRRPPSRRVFGRAAMLCVLVCLPAVAACAYIEKARGMNDLAVTTSQFYKLDRAPQGAKRAVLQSAADPGDDQRRRR
jgi:hypothetical protein